MVDSDHHGLTCDGKLVTWLWSLDEQQEWWLRNVGRAIKRSWIQLCGDVMAYVWSDCRQQWLLLRLLLTRLLSLIKDIDFSWCLLTPHPGSLAAAVFNQFIVALGVTSRIYLLGFVSWGKTNGNIGHSGLDHNQILKWSCNKSLICTSPRCKKKIPQAPQKLSLSPKRQDSYREETP